MYTDLNLNELNFDHTKANASGYQQNLEIQYFLLGLFLLILLEKIEKGRK